MTLWIIIKNNMKLMFRNKALLALMVLGPIFIISALSNAFHGLLSDSYEMEKFTVGIRVNDDSQLTSYRNTLVKVFEDQDINCIEYKTEEPEDVLRDQKADVFIDIRSDKYEIYKDSSKDTQAQICQFIMYQILHQQFAGSSDNIRIKTSSLPFIKTANASDYYGMIEIIYFIWGSMFFLSSVIQSERKNRIQQRFVMSPISRMTNYLGRFLPGVTMTVVGTGISTIVVTFMFDIHWGNLPVTIGILFLGSIAGTALGLVSFYIVNNLAISVVIQMMMIWIWGFIGGSFETYMYSMTPERIKKLSPLYYMNRTVVELSTMGESQYTGKCVLVLLLVILISVITGLFLMNRRMEEK